jgi:hypothetical protein
MLPLMQLRASRSELPLLGHLPILTPDVIGIVQKIADANKIPGLTVAIVDKSGHVEFGAWGIKSENGTNMTTDVR